MQCPVEDDCSPKRRKMSHRVSPRILLFYVLYFFSALDLVFEKSADSVNDSSKILFGMRTKRRSK